MPERPVITITTDFGSQDHFVGVMKGVILSINLEAKLVDISHQVNSYDLTDGAFTLAQSYRYFPSGSIHLVVVDPGVGSSRRAIVAQTPKYLFVAPDNGVLSAVYEGESDFKVYNITATGYFLKPVSNTFHGRDIFAPVAAWLSRGIEPEKFGQAISDYITIPLPRVEWQDGRVLKGMVQKIDKFGNLITNIRPQDIPDFQEADPSGFRTQITGLVVTQLNRSYATSDSSQLFMIFGSSGFLEIAVCRGSAAERVGAVRGTPVELILEKPRS